MFDSRPITVKMYRLHEACAYVTNECIVYQWLLSRMIHLSTQSNVNFETNIVFCYYFLGRQKEKQMKSKTHKQTINENVFTQDISVYDSVVSRTEDNYQEPAKMMNDYNASYLYFVITSQFLTCSYINFDNTCFLQPLSFLLFMG